MPWYVWAVIVVVIVGLFEYLIVLGASRKKVKD